MRTDVLGKAVRAQGGAVVKPHQVKAMILAARRAYIEQAKLGLVDDGVGFDAWRRATLHDVVGAAAPSSFRTVTQRDYVAVMRYFGELAGESLELRAESLELRGVGGKLQAPSSKLKAVESADERRRALWTLNLVEGEVAEAFGGREGAARYADALFGKIHRTVRYAATARQVWAVIFTLRSRAAKKKLKAKSLELRGVGDKLQAPSFKLQALTRARTGLGARGASGVPSSPPKGSERFPAFSRAFPAIPG